MIEGIVSKHSDGKSGVFVFGSSLISDNFDDIDLGFEKIEKGRLAEMKEAFETSNLPYKVDLVDFSKTKSAFREKVYKGKILCIIPKKK